jgi:hypothetical protein
MTLCGAIQEAVQVADTTQPNGASDYLLRQLVERSEDKSRIHHILERMQDKRTAARLTVQYLHHWPLDIAL